MMFRATAIFLLWFVCGCSCQGPPPTPCPDVFSYQRDPSGRWYGLVTILSPATFSEARLILKMTVANYRLDKGYGQIQVLGGESEVQEISKSAYKGVRRKIQFLVNFPPISTIPRVTEVLINDVSFCSHHHLEHGDVGKIELNYVLKTGLNVLAVSGYEFSPASQQGHVQSPILNQNTWNQNIPPPPGQSPIILNQNTWNQNIPPPPPVQRPIPSQNIPNRPISVPQLAQRPIPSQDISPTPAPTRATNRPQRRKTTTTTPIYDYDEDESAEEDKKMCGRNSNDHNLLIVNGSPAKKEEWPWHSALYKNGKTGLNYLCGGSLVSKRYIVTAAHCVYDRQKKATMPKEMITVFLGKHDLANWSEKSQQLVSIEKILVHPEFTPMTLSHDAAIFKISSAKYNDFVRPVCLWDQPPISLVNKIGTVVGWGLDESASYPTKRRVVEMPVVDENTCLRSDTSFFGVFTDEFNYCAGFKNGSGVCSGDSGAGMMFKLQNRIQGQETWYLRGVVSSSKVDPTSKLQCDVYDYMVFTDVVKLLPWLREEMQKT